MRKLFLKKMDKQTLDQIAETMPVLSEKEARACIGGGTVRITVNRSYYGDQSTMSYFLATAYDDNGNVVDSMSGMFLEPTADYDRAHISGSDTAIKYGTYDVKPSTYRGVSGYYEVTGVDGRSAIKIHAGNTGRDTEGCLLPGVTGSYDSQTGESRVSGSRAKLRELTEFLDKYGSDGIKMEISM